MHVRNPVRMTDNSFGCSFLSLKAQWKGSVEIFVTVNSKTVLWNMIFISLMQP